MPQPGEKSISNNIPQEEPRPNREEGWALLKSMEGTMTGWFDKYGGADEWLRKHRAILRASQRIESLDALHLACAATAQTDVFMTNDQRLFGRKVNAIGSIMSIDRALL